MRPVAVIALLCAAMVIAGCSFGAKQDARQQSALELELAGEMVSVPGGTFRMGDLSGAGDYDELPVRNVTVPAFRLGKHEVTFAQWDACVADGSCTDFRTNFSIYTNIRPLQFSETVHEFFDEDMVVDCGCNRNEIEDMGCDPRSCPVVNVSWNEVRSFIGWLNRKTGGNYRLPTEAEWEYTARAGSTTEYSWGNDIVRSSRANCIAHVCDDWGYHPAPAGSFPANPWGLHDMHGNVGEWVQDCKDYGYEGAPTDGGAWTSGDCNWRVIRGGSWGSLAEKLRSAARLASKRSDRDKYTGFRLAQDE